jgi:hypothetical protein
MERGVNDCATCSRHQTAYNVERADLLRAAAAVESGRMDADMLPVFTRRALAALEAKEAHEQEHR